MTRTIGIVLFPDFEDLDAIGPREALTMMAKFSGGDWQVVLVSEDGGPVTSFLGTRYLVDHNYEDCPPLEVLLVPGGLGTRAEMKNPKHRPWSATPEAGTGWTSSPFPTDDGTGR